ncbi:hypothetical protein ACWIUD_02525 [Helicobacter sp. 23-1044]
MREILRIDSAFYAKIAESTTKKAHKKARKSQNLIAFRFKNTLFITRFKR